MAECPIPAVCLPIFDCQKYHVPLLLARIISIHYANADYLVLIKTSYWLDYLLILRGIQFIVTGTLLRVKTGAMNNYRNTTGINQEVWSSLGEVGRGLCKITTEPGTGL